MNERKTCKQILASDEKVLKVNLNNVFRITKSQKLLVFHTEASVT